ncbi:hypothetical protein ACLB1E_03275 [Escherichia coli]
MLTVAGVRIYAASGNGCTMPDATLARLIMPTTVPTLGLDHICAGHPAICLLLMRALNAT